MFRREAEKLCVSAQCAARVWFKPEWQLPAKSRAFLFSPGGTARMAFVSTESGSDRIGKERSPSLALIPSLPLRVPTRHSSDRTATLRNEFEGVILKKYDYGKCC